MTMMKMEGDPDQHPRGRGDAVRALLNSDTAPVHEPRQLHHPQDTPLPSHPRPFSSEHLPPTTFASHPRPPPSTSSHQPTYSAPPPQFSPRPPSDPRGYPVHSPQQSHSGHGTPVGPHPNPYPPPDVKPPPPQPPPQHSYGPHHPPPDHFRRALAPIQGPPGERPPTTMDHGAPHPMYGAPEQQHHHVNGNGHHPHYHIESHPGYGAPSHVAQPQSYAPSPVSTHHGYGSYSQSSARKKQVRAQQACNQCRQRKQKCDEDRPCTYCRDNNLVCEYKDVPPPKTDRTMQQILDKLTAIESSVNRRMDKLESHLHLKPDTNGTSVSPTATHQTGPRSGSRDVSMVSTDEQPMPDSPQPREGPIAHEEPPRVEHIYVTRLDDHKTAAHHLLRDWGTIEKYFHGVVSIEENYPMTLEEKRGSLRLYGRGEGLSHSDRVQQQQIGSPAQSEPDSFITSPSETPSSSSDDYSNNPIGILQQCSYEAEHVNQLVNSYIENMHTFHPFLDKGRLLKQVEDFVKKMDPPVEAMSNGTMSPSAIPTYLANDTRPHKKRRTDSGVLQDNNARGDHSKPPEKPDSTITNAIILLVLALGAICLEHGRVNGPIKGRVRMDQSKKFIGMPSPVDDVNSPTAASPQATTENSGNGIEVKKNQDVIPGLRYFTIASDILGNMHSGNEVYHAQAFLLASLYINQLGRVLESYSWINSAARVIKINVKSNKDYLGHLENGRLAQYPPNMKGNETAQKRYIAKLDLIKATFWSAVQLESDILAEMSLPPSHITDYESIVAYPAGVHDDLVMMDFSEEDNYKMFYTAQIWLRKTLNAVHTHVYGANRKAPQFQIGVYKPAYTDTNLILVNLSDLYSWRRSESVQKSAKVLRWDDNDPPASELNIVRLRAKYYGAEYVMTRPYLHYAVHCPQSDRGMLQKAWEYVRSLEKIDKNLDNYDWINNAQNLPNTPDCDRSGIHLDAITTILLCRICIIAAMRSTTAFDGMRIRLKVTNIFGTLHAQFGNCLVLAAVCESWLRDLHGLIDQPRVPELIKSTMHKCENSKHLSPALGYDSLILKHALSSVQPMVEASRHVSTPSAMEGPSRRQSGYAASANSSFG